MVKTKLLYIRTIWFFEDLKNYILFITKQVKKKRNIFKNACILLFRSGTKLKFIKCVNCTEIIANNDSRNIRNLIVR